MYFQGFLGITMDADVGDFLTPARIARETDRADADAR
jgi:hypothetical protein